MCDGGDFEQELAERIRSEFGGPDWEAELVAAKAERVRRSGLLDDTDQNWTPEFIVKKIGEAADELRVPGKWNWWIGELDLFISGMAEFQIDEY